MYFNERTRTLITVKNISIGKWIRQKIDDTVDSGVRIETKALTHYWIDIILHIAMTVLRSLYPADIKMKI